MREGYSKLGSAISEKKDKKISPENRNLLVGLFVAIGLHAGAFSLSKEGRSAIAKKKVAIERLAREKMTAMFGAEDETAFKKALEDFEQLEKTALQVKKDEKQTPVPPPKISSPSNSEASQSAPPAESASLWSNQTPANQDLPSFTPVPLPEIEFERFHIDEQSALTESASPTISDSPSAELKESPRPVAMHPAELTHTAAVELIRKLPDSALAVLSSAPTEHAFIKELLELKPSDQGAVLLKAESFNGKSTEKVAAAVNNLNALRKDFFKLAQEEKNRLQVIAALLKKQGRYMPHNSFIADMLNNKVGNCESRAKFVVSTIPAIYPDMEIVLQWFGGDIKHVRALGRIGNAWYALEARPTRVYDHELDGTVITNSDEFSRMYTKQESSGVLIGDRKESFLDRLKNWSLHMTDSFLESDFKENPVKKFDGGAPVEEHVERYEERLKEEYREPVKVLESLPEEPEAPKAEAPIAPVEPDKLDPEPTGDAGNTVENLNDPIEQATSGELDGGSPEHSPELEGKYSELAPEHLKDGGAGVEPLQQSGTENATSIGSGDEDGGGNYDASTLSKVVDLKVTNESGNSTAVPASDGYKPSAVFKGKESQQKPELDIKRMIVDQGAFFLKAEMFHGVSEKEVFKALKKLETLAERYASLAEKEKDVMKVLFNLLKERGRYSPESSYLSDLLEKQVGNSEARTKFLLALLPRVFPEARLRIQWFANNEMRLLVEIKESWYALEDVPVPLRSPEVEGTVITQSDEFRRRYLGQPSSGRFIGEVITPLEPQEASGSNTFFQTNFPKPPIRTSKLRFEENEQEYQARLARSYDEAQKMARNSQIIDVDVQFITKDQLAALRKPPAPNEKAPDNKNNHINTLVTGVVDWYEEDDLSKFNGMALRGINTMSNKISDLSPLKDMPLEGLSFHGAQVSDLSPLRGKSIREIFFSQNKVVDLSPLKGMPIESIDISGNPITDLSPLRGMPIHTIYMHDLEITDISPLRGLPLKAISLGTNYGKSKLQDLTPLRGARLESLSMTNTQINDLSPLQGMPLEYLYLEGSPVSDLSPLIGAPLTSINLKKTLVRDLRPLKDRIDQGIITIEFDSNLEMDTKNYRLIPRRHK